MGCVARDINGQWLVGEARGVGRAEPLSVELCAIYYGLQLTWKRNYRNVILRSDSLDAIRLILGGGNGNADDRELTEGCKVLLTREWVVEVEHVFREGNRVADWLAKSAIR